MKVSCLVKPISLMLMTVVLSIGSASVWAADAAPAKAAPPPPPKEAPPSREMREKMAQMHEKVAVCLRSERPAKECHEEMMKSCHDAGEHACGMMGPMGDRHKMMMHGDDEHDHDHAKPGTTPPPPKP